MTVIDNWLYCNAIKGRDLFKLLQNQNFKGTYTNVESTGKPLIDSLFYLEEQAPLFRKGFRVEKEVKNATLFITSAGYYAAFINSKRVGKNVLDPAWTDYTKKIYYTEYDITSLVINGDNSIGVTLGNGFYNPLPLKMWGRINLRN